MESDVRSKVGEEQGRVAHHATRAVGQRNPGSVPEPAQDNADDEWLAFATGDPAFFIKPSDAVQSASSRVLGRGTGSSSRLR
jgi:hypothetical protein